MFAVMKTQEEFKIPKQWSNAELQVLERLWNKLLPNFGSFKDHYREEPLLCLYVYKGRVTYKVSALLDKLEELFPEDFRTLSVENIIRKHYSEDALKLLHSLNGERLL